MAYCSQLPPFWRNLYAGLFGSILLITVLVRFAMDVRTALAGCVSSCTSSCASYFFQMKLLCIMSWRYGRFTDTVVASPCEKTRPRAISGRGR